jgi:Protein of unknown function (DUF2905)
MNEMGKTLVGLGLALAVLGALVMAAARFGMPLGRLPGDFSFKGKNFSFYFPLGTSIAISVAVTVILYLIARMRR